jgi:CBS domain-containing protein
VDVLFKLAGESVAAAEPIAPVVVQPDWSVRDVFTHLQSEGRSTALVCQDGRLIGIFTERDAVRVMTSRIDLDAPINTVMSTEPKSVAPTDTILRAIQLMASGKCRRLPVVDEQGHPQGIIQTAGIVRLLVEYFPRCVYNLPPDPHSLIQDREGS